MPAFPDGTNRDRVKISFWDFCAVHIHTSTYSFYRPKIAACASIFSVSTVGATNCCQSKALVFVSVQSGDLFTGSIALFAKNIDLRRVDVRKFCSVAVVEFSEFFADRAPESMEFLAESIELFLKSTAFDAEIAEFRRVLTISTHRPRIAFFAAIPLRAAISSVNNFQRTEALIDFLQN